MKTEMKMMSNGNYEEIVSPIQHKCYYGSGSVCVENGWNLGKLKLSIVIDDDDTKEIYVKFCPFCGYKPEVDIKP
jgi:hypothetical protein